MTAAASTPLEAAQTIESRLRDACVAYRDAQEVAERTAKKRRQLIVEAIDELGWPHKRVAEIVGVSRTRLHAIILSEYREP